MVLNLEKHELNLNFDLIENSYKFDRGTHEQNKKISAMEHVVTEQARLINFRCPKMQS